QGGRVDYPLLLLQRKDRARFQEVMRVVEERVSSLVIISQLPDLIDAYQPDSERAPENKRILRTGDLFSQQPTRAGEIRIELRLDGPARDDFPLPPTGGRERSLVKGFHVALDSFRRGRPEHRTHKPRALGNHDGDKQPPQAPASKPRGPPAGKSRERADDEERKKNQTP